MPDAAGIRRGAGAARPNLPAAWLPVIALAVMLAVVFGIRPAALSYFGVNLLLNFSVPLLLAALAQMLIIGLGDIDLSIGSFVGFVTCVAAVFFTPAPWPGLAILAGAIAAQAGIALLIHCLSLPSIIVTLGMSFVWLGLSLLILPTPGGLAPAWLTGLFATRPPLLPLPVWIALLAAAGMHWAVKRSSYGVVLRGVGANPKAVAHAGWSLLRVRMWAYAAAATLAVLSGLALSAITTSGDPRIAPAYTLLSIGSVILGGGAFTGGIVSPAGCVIGAITLSLAGSLLSFLDVPPVWQAGAQGAILLLVLSGRVLLPENKP